MVTPPNILPLRLTGAVIRRRSKTLVGPIDMTVGANGFTIVMGPNGAGKTSLLRMMHGLERLSEGRLDWAVPAVEARRHQSYVFQTPIVLRRSTLDNVAYPLIVHGMAKAEARERAALWLTKVGLVESARKQAACLSGGERQKLALARALIRNPQILFLDEPCANLDGRAVRDIEEILGAAHAGGTRIVMITHDKAQAERLAEEIVFIHHGRLHETASANNFFHTQKTSEAAAFLKGEILL